MPDGNDVMNQMIRQGRSDPVDFTDHRAVNASIRAAAGRPPGADPVSVLGPPPLPGEDLDAFNTWADAAAEAGLDRKALAAYAGRWLEQHRQVVADRELEQ